MENKLFSKGIFKEAFNQLKIVGFIAVAVYMVAGMLTPLGYIIDEFAYSSEKHNIIFAEEYFCILFGLMYIYVPVMMLVVFFWQTRRHACDFYHAIPIKREKIYFSSLVAVLAWIGLIVVSAIIVPLGFVMMPNVEMDWGNFLKIMVYILAGCIQMMGVFSLGIMLTGHGLTNVVASLMILFVPRGILTAIIAMTDELMPFSSIDLLNSFINPVYNIGFGSFFSVLSEDMEGKILIPVIYSIVLGLIYITLGGFLFKIRKSEAASSASIYGFVQIVFRMIPSYVFALIGVYFILENYNYRDYDIEYYFFALVFFSISILAYFIYELITTRKWRSVGRSAKQLPILAGLVALTAISIVAGTNIATRRNVDADKMEFIEVEFMEHYLSGLASADSVIIKDEEVFKLIENAYKEQVEKYYSDGDGYWKHTRYDVGINQGGATFYREVHMTLLEKETFMKAYKKALNDAEVVVILPEYEELEDVYLSQNEKITGQRLETLYNCLKEELKSVPYSDLVDVEDDAIDTVCINTYYDYYRVEITDKTPLTKQLYISMYMQNMNSNNDEFIKAINKIQNNGYLYLLPLHLEITIISSEETYNYYIDTEYEDMEIKENIIALFDKTTENTGESLIMIRGSIGAYNEIDDELKYEYISYWVDSTYVISDELVKEYVELFKGYKY